MLYLNLMEIITTKKKEKKKKRTTSNKQNKKRNCLNYTYIIYNLYEHKLYFFLQHALCIHTY